MPKLTVTLTKSWNKRIKKITVLDHDTVLGIIHNGETSEFDIAAGSHKVKVKAGWYGSRELLFSVNEAETKSLDVDIFKYGNLIINSLITVLSIHFIALTFYDIKYLALFNIPAFLILGYFLTLGRNDYLVIREKQDFERLPVSS